MGLGAGEARLPLVESLGKAKDCLSSRVSRKYHPPPPPCCGQSQGPPTLHAKGRFLTPAPGPTLGEGGGILPTLSCIRPGLPLRDHPWRPGGWPSLLAGPTSNILPCLKECPGLAGFCGLPTAQGILSSPPHPAEAAPALPLGRGPGWERLAQHRDARSIPRLHEIPGNPKVSEEGSGPQ